MLDDPKKELEQLEEELHCLEAADEEFESMYAEIVDEYGESSTSDEEYLKQMMEDDPHETDPSAMDFNVYSDNQKAPANEEKSIRALIVLIVLEVLGIAALLAWWAIRLL